MLSRDVTVTEKKGIRSVHFFLTKNCSSSLCFTEEIYICKFLLLDVHSGLEQILVQKK